MLFKQNKKEKKKITSKPNKILPFGLSCRYSENFDDRLRTYTNVILSVDTVSCRIDSFLAKLLQKELVMNQPNYSVDHDQLKITGKWAPTTYP
jgi:hypothetical protein